MQLLYFVLHFKGNCSGKALNYTLCHFNLVFVEHSELTGEDFAVW